MRTQRQARLDTAGQQNDVIKALLVHSPLVGPATLEPLAVAFRQQGWAATVPDLTSAVSSPGRFIDAASQVGASVDVVVGHSGAGAFLPSIVAAVGGATAVYVDAVVPTSNPDLVQSPMQVQLLDALNIVDGVLPAWNEWWPSELFVELVPDETMRDRIVAELPRVRRSFFDQRVPLPSRWWTRPAVYIQLSPVYDDDRTRAQDWGWPTTKIGGRHLDVCVRPRLVADHVISLLDVPS